MQIKNNFVIVKKIERSIMIQVFLLFVFMTTSSHQAFCQEAPPPEQPTEQKPSNPQENSKKTDPNDVDSLDFDDDLDDDDLDDCFEMKTHKNR